MLNPSSYIQYLTRQGQIKTVDVSVVEGEGVVVFTVSGIQEEFFLLNLFHNNKKVEGLTFGNIQNLQMLAFLNSDFQTVEAIPDQFYINAFEVVEIRMPSVVGGDSVVSVDNFPLVQSVAIAQEAVNVVVANMYDMPQVEFPTVQNVEIVNQKPVKVQALPSYRPFRYPFPQDAVLSDNIIALSVVPTGDDILVRSYSDLPAIPDLEIPWEYSVPKIGSYFEFDFNGYTFFAQTVLFPFSFFVNKLNNSFDLLVTDLGTLNRSVNVASNYMGKYKGIYKFQLLDLITYQASFIYLSCDVAVGFNFVPF